MAAVLVVVSLAVPALVVSGPRHATARRAVVVDPGPPGGPLRVVTPARLRLYGGRIVVALRHRKRRFDAAAALLAARLTRLESIAGRVEAAGGDVTKVKDLISQARSKLDQAKATEAKAVDAFEAVPSASDKRAAFRSAREIGKQAVAELKEARGLGKQAVAELRKIINELKAEEGSQ